MKPIFLDKEDVKKKAHYSPAVVHENLVYISGQLPLLKGETKPASDDIQYQTKIVLNKLKTILSAANSATDQVLKVTIYLSDINNWDIVNEVYAEFFGSHRPARTIVPTSVLHYNCLIELDAIAYVK
ncbi:MAG: RidA family protein [Asgard group archaeon]|nr:RidA family protein [Asgard group archaeon]